MPTDYETHDFTEIVDLIKAAYDKMGEVLDRDELGFIDGNAPEELEEVYNQLQEAYTTLSSY